MKATDFDLRRDLKLDAETGVATFNNNRVVMFDSAALGLLRHTLISELGWDRARALLLRFGYGQGFSDFGQMSQRYQFDTELDLLASGPVIHTWEGVVKAVPTDLKYSRESGEFHFTGRWLNSYEAEQHLCFAEVAQEPVCWQLAGYAAGWCSAFFGRPLIAMEPACVGKGDAECGWLIQPVAKWGKEAKPIIEALAPLLGV